MTIIEIEKPPLFSFRECLWFLNREYDDCLLSFEENKISRAIRAGNEVISFTISDQGDKILLEIADQKGKASWATEVQKFVEEWLDLKRDISPFYAILGEHPQLGYMADEYKGLRLIGNPETFEALIWSIISQQINLTFAFKLKRALIEKYGDAIEHNGQPILVFPTPEVLASLLPEDLQALQFSKQKANYIISSAKAFASGEISKSLLLEMSSQERIDKLVSLKGVGLWTANAVLMQSLNDMTGLPLGDVGLLKALVNHNLIIDRSDSAGVDAVFNHFDGWQGYLVNYLWRSLTKPVDLASSSI